MTLPQEFINHHAARLSERDFRLLERCVSTLQANLLLPSNTTEGQVLWHKYGERLAWCMRPAQEFDQPLPWAPRRGIIPSPFVYRGIWNWDAAFHALAVARWDADLARDQVLILLDHQLPSGALPDVIFENGRVVNDFGKPPVMPWAAAVIDRLAPDNFFLSQVYGKFTAYAAFWESSRRREGDDLFHYDVNRCESGWDNSPRWDAAFETLFPVDLNTYMVMLYQSLAHIASRLGELDEALRWTSKSMHLAQAVNALLYNPTTGAYQDYDFACQSFSPVLTPACFMPLYARFASSDQAESMAGFAADSRGFFPGFPSVAYGDPGWSANYWRGPVWLNIAYFALKGLQFYGFDTTANACRETLLAWAAANEDFIYEYYDSNTGKGLGAPQFSWSAAFLIELLVNWQPGSLY